MQPFARRLATPDDVPALRALIAASAIMFVPRRQTSLDESYMS